MNNPDLYVVCSQNDLETDNWECGSNFAYMKTRAVERAERSQGPTIVYKLVPVFEARLEVITNVITKELEKPL